MKKIKFISKINKPDQKITNFQNSEIFFYFDFFKYNFYDFNFLSFITFHFFLLIKKYQKLKKISLLNFYLFFGNSRSSHRHRKKSLKVSPSQRKTFGKFITFDFF
jgi:hypothetical protein